LGERHVLAIARGCRVSDLSKNRVTLSSSIGDLVRDDDKLMDSLRISTADQSPFRVASTGEKSSFYLGRDTDDSVLSNGKSRHNERE